MAFLFCDSFDHYTANADFNTKYPSPGGLGSFNAITAAAGRRSTASHRCSSTTNASVKYLAPADATFVMGCALKSNSTVDKLVFDVADDTVTHVEIQITTAGRVDAYRGAGSTLLGSSSTGAFNQAIGYQYIELKVTVSDTVGVVKVNIDGTTVLNLTAQDTRNAGTAGWTNFKLWHSSGGTNVIDMDDLYVLDGSGSSLNDFLGDTRVDVHYPTGNGNTSNSTPSTGVNRGTTVDETAPNSDTDYNTITNVGDKDTLTLADFAVVGGTPLAVQVVQYAKKTDAGVGTLCTVLRHSGTDYDNTALGLNTSYQYTLVNQYGLNPAGGTWTESDFNALEVGYKRVS